MNDNFRETITPGDSFALYGEKLARGVGRGYVLLVVEMKSCRSWWLTVDHAFLRRIVASN